MKYYIHTYGCQMNVHESEKLAGTLIDMGYIETESIDDADIILFNTCAIREGAQDKVFGNVGALKKLKKQKRDVIIAICGCMTQQTSIANEIYKKFPFVDIIFGTHNVHEFKQFILKHQLEKKRQVNIAEDSPYIWEDYKAYRTSGNNAWVNIMYGCNNFCTYCIVPYVRGREKSRAKENIIEEVKQLVQSGRYNKITLLGQNVNSYGTGLYTDYCFADLLSDLCKIDGDFTLSFMTSHPKDISDKLIDVMSKEDKIEKYLHLPLQSGSNAILTKMNRKYTREQYLSIIDKVKTKIPNVVLSSDFIVGFPGETEDDFNATMDIVNKVKYDNIFAFMYSIRPGTVAEKMDNQIPLEVKNRRVNELLALQKNIKKEK